MNTLCAILIVFLSCVSTIQTTARPARGNGLIQGALGTKHNGADRSSRNVVSANARIGSRPPSCINKCDACTPCQAVQASQSLAEMTTNIGSRPPSCQNKCNRCIPCQAVQVPTPIQRKVPGAASSSETRNRNQGDHGTQQNQMQEQEQVSVQYSNYKPEGWRCKCGNKLFNP